MNIRKSIGLLSLAALGASPAGAETLTVSISGVRSAAGELQADVYAEGRKRVARQRLRAAVGTARAVIADLAPGAYAIEVYHDENANRRLDTGGLIGLPIEGYGFSNDAKIRMGPPSFEAMRVDVPAGAAVATTIRLRYPRAAR